MRRFTFRNKFNIVSLPKNFTLVNKITKMGRDNSAISLKETQKPNKEKIHRGKGKCKSSNEDKDKDGKNKKAFGLIKNKDQVPEFKMKEGES